MICKSERLHKVSPVRLNHLSITIVAGPTLCLLCGGGIRFFINSTLDIPTRHFLEWPSGVKVSFATTTPPPLLVNTPLLWLLLKLALDWVNKLPYVIMTCGFWFNEMKKPMMMRKGNSWWSDCLICNRSPYHSQSRMWNGMTWQNSSWGGFVMWFIYNLMINRDLMDSIVDSKIFNVNQLITRSRSEDWPVWLKFDGIISTIAQPNYCRFNQWPFD